MNNDVKTGYELAEKELKEKQVQEVKRIATKTLEKLADVDKKIKDLQEQKKILKMDIEDLKEGKLDRMVERQEIDPKAKEVSVVIIIKEKEIIKEYNPWHYPYTVIWQKLNVSLQPIFVTNATNWTSQCCTTTSQNFCGGGGYSTITCSVAKDATVGTYNVNGETEYIR